jgi:hypothetical protein
MSETANAVRSVVTWFEIPATDFDRARRFYEAIFETEIPVHARCGRWQPGASCATTFATFASTAFAGRDWESDSRPNPRSRSKRFWRGSVPSEKG